MSNNILVFFDLLILICLFYTISGLRKQKKILKDINSLERQRGDRWKESAKDWGDELKQYKERIVNSYKEAFTDMEKRIKDYQSEIVSEKNKTQETKLKIKEYENKLLQLKEAMQNDEDVFLIHITELNNLYLEGKELELLE